MNETGTRQRADNISGLLGEKEMASYIYSQPKEKLAGYFIQIGIDDFGMINNVHGQTYGNYILKRVAECIADCLLRRSENISSCYRQVYACGYVEQIA